MQIAVLGAGSWGTALAIILARNGHETTLLGRSEEEIAAIRGRRENMRYLPGFPLPEGVRALTFGEAPAETEMLVVAVPSSGVRDSLSRLQTASPILTVASKGLEPASAKLLSEVAAEARPDAAIGAISGPNLAVELARGVPTASVAACRDLCVAETIARAFNCRTLRIYITDDVIGIELAGALKNVLALAAGMSDGLGFGDNTKGALLARGLREMTLLGAALGARPATFMGIAGVGDLFATANSRLSRNYRVGVALGQGASLAESLNEVGQVAEGVPTVESAVTLSRRHGLRTPIFEGVREVLSGHLRPAQAVAQLMENQPKREDA